MKKVLEIDDEIEKLESEYAGLEYEKNFSQDVDDDKEIPFNADKIRIDQQMLNDYGQKIYFGEDKNESVALKNLASKYGIICSGKGSNENIEYKEIYKGVEITCNPHTKLHSRYSNQRIYFCWGRDEIENHKIIIVKIGDHWKK